MCWNRPAGKLSHLSCCTVSSFSHYCLIQLEVCCRHRIQAKEWGWCNMVCALQSEWSTSCLCSRCSSFVLNEILKGISLSGIWRKQENVYSPSSVLWYFNTQPLGMSAVTWALDDLSKILPLCTRQRLLSVSLEMLWLCSVVVIRKYFFSLSLALLGE